MKGSAQQVEATHNRWTPFWRSAEYFWRQTHCKLLWQPVAVFFFHVMLYWISLFDLLLLYLVLMISNERGKIGHWILLIHSTLSAPVI